MIKTKGILHVTIPVSDLARSRAFYTDILGLEFVAQVPKENPHFVFLKSGADYVLLGRDTSRGRFSDTIHHAFMVDGDAYDATVAELKPRAWTCSGRINATKASLPAAAPISTTPTITRSKSFISLTGRKAEMTRRLELTFACGDYEIMRALKEGIVRPEGIELTVLTDMAPSPRHWRFLRGREFDLAEVSGSGYVAARDQDLPFRAIPVFPHRRFRHGFIFINTSKGISKPTDLIGRKVGTKGYLFTAGLWMRGILEHDYGVPHKSIEWLSELDEDVDFTPPPGLKITQVPQEKSLEEMLVAGEIDALLSPDLIRPLTSGDKRVGRLFPNYKEEEIAFYGRTGIFPIMHVVGIKQEIVERYPWVAINLYKAFEEAKALAMKRMENPRIVPLAWYREGWEEQECILRRGPWEYGLTERNAKNFERLVTYSHEQGLIKRRPPLDELFLNVSEGRKRDEFRI